ncbi:MAG: phosphoglucosamine mutase [Gammaproteobacteria bacterium]|jgi:phosphoglucosamine mutase
MRLGWAAGRVLAKEGKGPVIIGKDTRISGYMFESALEAGLSAAGVDVRLIGPMPTPGIAFLTQNTRAQAGIVISASHNPFQDNGIKFFCADGKKLSDAVEFAIEVELDKHMEVVSSHKLGKAKRIEDAPRRYIEYCKSRVAADLKFNALRIVVDCAHGATYHIAPHVFEELGAEVVSIGVSPDGLNINKDYGATSPDNLAQAVSDNQADLGIALDGDGDRLIMIDNKGEVVDGDEALYIIASTKVDTLNGAVVGTQMSNLGLQHAIESLDMNFLRSAVGDRYVMELLEERGLKLGGESSGHIINLNLASTGDGTISALQVLESMVKSNKSLHELKNGMKKYPQKLVNVKLQRKVSLNEFPAIDEAVKEVENELGERGRVLLRPSGTEPLVRVMVEGEDDIQVHNLAHSLAERVQEVLSQA